jgi:hypothetical protein
MRQSEPHIPKPDAPSAAVAAKEETPVATAIAKVRPIKRAVAAVGVVSSKHAR